MRRNYRELEEIDVSGGENSRYQADIGLDGRVAYGQE